MKTILITGAGSGLGKLASIELAKRGHFVYATTHTDLQAIELNNLSKFCNLPISSFKLDILSSEDRNIARNLDFDVLINNAAIGDSGSACDISIDRYRNVFETNVFSSLELTQIVLSNMIAKGSGRIIFISSLAGKYSIPFLSPYCSSKFALEGIIPCLDKEVKYLKDVKIPIILIEPGAYSTGFNQKNISKQFIYMRNDSYFKNYCKQLKRKQFNYFRFRESKNFYPIINQYILAVEDETPKKRYTAPVIQSCYVKFKACITN